MQERSGWVSLVAFALIRLGAICVALALWFVAGLMDFSDHHTGPSPDAWRQTLGWWASGLTVLFVLVSLVPFRKSNTLATVAFVVALVSFLVVIV